MVVKLLYPEVVRSHASQGEKLDSCRQFALKEPPARCHICDRAVPLESSKADEYGRAVHEDCYVELLVLNRQAATTTLTTMLRKPSFPDEPEDGEPKDDEPKHKQWGNSALTPTTVRKRNSLRMPRWSADAAAVVALAIIAWYACTDHRQASPPGASKAVYEQQPTPVTDLEAASSMLRRIRIGQNEVDYIAEDVTIRIFKHNPEASPMQVAYKQVNFGKDVTVRYISPKPTVRPEANTAQPEDSSSPLSDKPVSRPSTRCFRKYPANKSAF